MRNDKNNKYKNQQNIQHRSLGSDLVNWLFENVDGFVNRNDARKYASSMLKAGYIRHTVHKLTFSEQCYYVFGDIYYQGEKNRISILHHRLFSFRNVTIDAR